MELVYHFSIEIENAYKYFFFEYNFIIHIFF